MSEQNLSVTLKETRQFKPAPSFVSKAMVGQADYERMLKQGASDPETYWAEAARELSWFEPFKETLKWEPPSAQWFLGGKLNASFNCLDRHVETQGSKAAIVWEGEPGEIVTWTYRELLHHTERLTAGLRQMGLKRGDRIAIYMPLVPEAAAAMLACARGGFPHTVVFGGFSSEALKDRINDAGARAVITADFGYRKGQPVQLRTQVDAAIENCPSVEFVVSLDRARAGFSATELTRSFSAPDERAVGKKSGRITAYNWHELLGSLTREEQKRLGSAESLDSEHPLFILYTSGTTGKPKGIVHSTGGYLTGVLRTSKLVFDLKPSDHYWCTADIGWITGHSYLVYGPLAAGASIFMYEGAPTTPTPDRFWAMIERHQISILYTAPTAIRAFMKQGVDLPKSRDLTSLRLLGTVGEPINPEAWMWYRDTIGGGRCPIVDTYWQTETGSIVVSPVPGVTPTKPGSATHGLPGYDLAVVDKKGAEVPLGTGGYLVIRKPWPAMARTIHGDHERFKKTYFSEFEGGIYFTGDGARKDEDGYIWCLGRVDDVLNVSGHRLGTMEIESSLVSHLSVAEAAVVGRPDELKGQGVVAFVTLKTEITKRAAGDLKVLESLKQELKAHVTKEIGAIARPDEIRFTEGLPKTRSGKIMRRLLRELATGGSVKGDTTTLEDLNVIAALQKDDEE